MIKIICMNILSKLYDQNISDIFCIFFDNIVSLAFDISKIKSYQYFVRLSNIVLDAFRLKVLNSRTRGNKIF